VQAGVKALRQEFSKPILDNQIKPLLDAWSPEVLPKSPIGKAVTYALNQGEALNRYLENGILCIDNSLSERMIKLVALGRKNWLDQRQSFLPGALTEAFCYQSPVVASVECYQKREASNRQESELGDKKGIAGSGATAVSGQFESGQAWYP
jgi:hypothetical protein